jgi:cysteine synthase B
MGLFAGISSGAAAFASAQIARANPGAVVVTIFPDGGSRYLSERFWSEGR